MTDFIKEPYNLQCGDHIAVKIKSHNGQWSQFSKPNSLGATIKVKPIDKETEDFNMKNIRVFEEDLFEKQLKWSRRKHEKFDMQL